jgi:DNA-binding transcriptional LysR family regulator
LEQVKRSELLMPRVLALFAQNYPQIDLKVQFNTNNCKNIVNREIDIAVVGGEIPEELKNLSIKPFVEDEFSLIISKSHPFAMKKKLRKKIFII